MPRNILLIVDDSELDRAILREIFRREFTVADVENGVSAISYVFQHKSEIAAIILDICMPVVNGFHVLENIRSIKGTEQIPIILVTAEAVEDNVLRGLESGAVDFLVKPVDPANTLDRVKNIVKNSRKAEAEQEGQPSKSLSMADLRSACEDGEKRMERFFKLRECEPPDHVERIRELTGILAARFLEIDPTCGYDRETAQMIGLAAAFHDVGKLGIPDEVLENEKLEQSTKKEWYQQHTLLGGVLFQPFFKDQEWTPFLEICRDCALYHHEKYNGSGYPAHLKGDQIPVAAQLVRTALEYDRFARKYYQEKDICSKVLQALTMQKGNALSPNMVECVAAAKAQLESLVQKVYKSGLFLDTKSDEKD
ncbi:MAG: response regulator [Oscillospiraceae bacterium]|nr:response regulator [Oscillospiraceae bacterium]